MTARPDLQSPALALGLAAALLGLCSCARPTRAPAPVAPSTAVATPPAPATNAIPSLKVLSPGRFALGSVIVDKTQRTVSFPARLNRAAGGMEYLLVTDYGKTHESILRTAVAPGEIHLGMLLLGARGTGGPAPTNRPSEFGGTPGVWIEGDPISVEIAWPAEDGPVRRGAEEMLEPPAGTPATTRREWVFNGSLTWRGTFLAQESGSILSLIPDPAALANLRLDPPAQGNLWTTVSGKTPPPDVAVTVTLHLRNSRVR